jgi:transcriptional regulator with XRE-family HTH domain
MPRHRHPIRLIRDTLSAVRGQRITQASFAKMLGVSASLINALESKGSRILSEDLRERIAMRFGVKIGPGRSSPPVCLMFPALPLEEGLRQYQEKQALVDTGALHAFDLHLVPVLRAAMLAAHKNKKAAILLDLFYKRTEQLIHELKIEGSYPAALAEIQAHHGAFPRELSSAAHDELMAYADAFMAKTGAKTSGRSRRDKTKP